MKVSVSKSRPAFPIAIAFNSGRQYLTVAAARELALRLIEADESLGK